MTIAWLIAAAAVAAAMPIGALGVRHARWTHDRRRAARTEWWRP